MDAARPYIRRGHRTVHGWCTPVDLRLIHSLGRIQERMGLSGPVAEIGVHHGKLFVLLSLLAGTGERAVAMDLFDDQAQNVDASGEGDEAVLLRNLARLAPARPAPVLIRANSLHIGGADVERAAGGKVRLFSVDGGHTPECAAHDMQTAWDALAPGGVIILDDYFNPRWPGVCEGTNRFMVAGGTRPVPFAIGPNKTYFTTDADAAGRYLEALVAAGFRTRHDFTEMFGRPVLYVGTRPVGLMRRVGHSAGWRRFRATPVGALVRRVARLLTGAGSPP